MRNEDELCGVAELGPALGRGIRRRNMRTDHNWEKEKNNMKPKEKLQRAKSFRGIGFIVFGKTSNDARGLTNQKNTIGFISIPWAVLVLSCTCIRVLYKTQEESSKKANASELHNRIIGLFMSGSLSEASTPHHVSTRHSTISGKPNRDLMYSKIKPPLHAKYTYWPWWERIDRMNIISSPS